MDDLRKLIGQLIVHKAVTSLDNLCEGLGIDPNAAKQWRLQKDDDALTDAEIEALATRAAALAETLQPDEPELDLRRAKAEMQAWIDPLDEMPSAEAIHEVFVDFFERGISALNGAPILTIIKDKFGTDADRRILNSVWKLAEDAVYATDDEGFEPADGGEEIDNEGENYRSHRLEAEDQAVLQAEIEGRLQESGFFEIENKLEWATDLVHRMGVVGEDDAVRAIILTGMTRLLDKTFSLYVRGDASAGKSHLLRTTQRLFPQWTLVKLSSGSEMSLVYEQEGHLHQVIVTVPEGDFLAEKDNRGFARRLRQLQSDGEAPHKTTEKDEATGRRYTVTKKVEGHLAVQIGGTALSIHAENDTRHLSVDVDASVRQTQAVMQAQNAAWTGAGDEAAALVAQDIAQMHDYQHWLHLTQFKVVAPWGHLLNGRVYAETVEMRRHNQKIQMCVNASALLNANHRERDASGRIVATVVDYRVAYDLLAGKIARAVDRELNDEQAMVLGYILKRLNGSQKNLGVMKSKNALVEIGLGEIHRDLKISTSHASRILRYLEEYDYIVDRRAHGSTQKWMLQAGTRTVEANFRSAVMPTPEDLQALIDKESSNET